MGMKGGLVAHCATPTQQESLVGEVGGAPGVGCCWAGNGSGVGEGCGITAAVLCRVGDLGGSVYLYVIIILRQLNLLFQGLDIFTYSICNNREALDASHAQIKEFITAKCSKVSRQIWAPSFH